MAELWVAVSYPVMVNIDFDCSKVMDDDYVEQKRNEAKDKADEWIIMNRVLPVIHDAEIPALIE